MNNIPHSNAKNSKTSSGQFAQNIMHFGNILRTAGLPIGSGSIIHALRAVEITGVSRREDFYWTLHCAFVTRRDQREIFDRAFHIFWRNPMILERMVGLAPKTISNESSNESLVASRRLLDAFLPNRPRDYLQEGNNEIIGDAAGSYSEQEVLQKMDFESMSADELSEAKKLIARIELPIIQIPTRRLVPDARGPRVDMRATLRSAWRSNPDMINLKRAAKKLRHPPLVILSDISGSMSRYSRMLLHFLHTITNDRDRIFTFVFGTRLTNITRFLRARDVDVALGKVTENVADWSGGTRIGQCIKDFNTRWSRRVLAQGAIVLLISDGLDRDSGEGLSLEVQRLHKSCRYLMWLNPLLRYDGFEPKSLGIRAILPHVDDFRTIHNLRSFKDLAAALAREFPHA